MILKDLLHRRKTQDLRKESKNHELTTTKKEVTPTKDITKSIRKSKSFMNLLSLKLPKSVSSSILKKSTSCNTLPKLTLTPPISLSGSKINSPGNVDEIELSNHSARKPSTFVDVSSSDIIDRYNHTSMVQGFQRVTSKPSSNKIVHPRPNSAMPVKFQTPQHYDFSQPLTPVKYTANSILIEDEIDTLSFEEDFSHSTTRQSMRPKTSSTFMGKTISLSSHGQFDSTMHSLSEPFTDAGSIVDANIQIYKHYSVSKPPLKFVSTSTPVESPPISPLTTGSLEPKLRSILGSYSIKTQEVEDCSTSKEVSYLEEDEDEIEDDDEEVETEGVEEEAEIENEERDTTELQAGPTSFTYNDTTSGLLNDAELDFTDDKIDMFRSELLDLVKKHKAIVQKQQEEIDHLKSLLIQEKKYTSFLSSSPKISSSSSPKEHPARAYFPHTPLPATPDNESLTSLLTSARSRRVRRAGFIPINITIAKDHDENLSDLLPPFRPSSSLPSTSYANVNNPHLYYDQLADSSGSLPALDQASGDKRNHSVSSNISSVMSVYHGNSTISSKDATTSLENHNLECKNGDYSPEISKEGTTLDHPDTSFTFQFYA